MESPEIQENIPLAPRTTLGVGGLARFFAFARSEAELRHALAWATARSLPAFVLGGGSNLVVSDAGFPGLVVGMNVRGIEVGEPGEDGAVPVTAGAGEDWDGFVRYAVARGLQGIECLAGIPGRVGATPVQNVGAYGQEVADTVTRVRAFDREIGETRDLTASDCGFAYRRSRFNSPGEMGRWVILSVTFALRPGAPAVLKYADLQRHFAGGGESPSLPAVYDAVREIRSRKGMVVRADDPDSRSAGSFFKNPVVAPDVWEELAAKASGAESVPHWPQPDGSVKVPAAWLIERSGFARGFAAGRAGLSTKHVLALVNRGGATAAEITALARRVQAGVVDAWGVAIAPEPVFLGFAPGDPALPENAVLAISRIGAVD